MENNPCTLIRTSVWILLLSVTTGLSNAVQAQGCSDAGFCSAGALHGEYGPEENLRNMVKFTFSFERGEQNTFIYSPQLEGRFFLDDASFIQIKIPYLIADGNLGTNHGLSDFIVSYTRTVWEKQSWKVALTGGMRLAAGNANDEINGHDLPMPYQPSLGTHDAIFGAALIYKDWSLSTGLQWPLIQNNNNDYMPQDFPDESGYYLSNELERQPDVMVRLERKFAWNSWVFRAGVLPIYHLAEDTYEIRDPMDPTQTQRVNSEGSQGLTLNFTGAAAYNFSNRWTASLAVGAPAIVRETRPDGLTRSLVVLPSIQYAF